MVRPGRRCAGRCADLICRARRGAGGEGEGQDHAERVRNIDGPDGLAVQSQHHRLEFRYLHDGAVAGRLHCEGGRQELVLHHCRLRVRPILEEQTAALVEKAGGKVLGKLRYPFPDTTDFSSYLQQAQAAGAQVLGLANAGLDTVNSIKQAHEFGLNKTMKICPLLIFITDVHSLGLDTAQGLTCTNRSTGIIATARAPSPSGCCRNWPTDPIPTWRMPPAMPRRCTT